VNPGLMRRFALEDAFTFVDYSVPQLQQALELKMKEHDVCATDAAVGTAMDILARARQRPSFGNIGTVDNILSRAKIRFQERQAKLPWDARSPDAPFEPVDFEADFDRAGSAADNLAKLFADVVGCEDIVKRLGTYQAVAQAAKARGKDPRDLVPMGYVFKGPPGRSEIGWYMVPKLNVY
jgi:hypothetical protein